eukprot:s357_g40.t1
MVLVLIILTPFTTSTSIMLFFAFRTTQARLMLLMIIHGLNPNAKLKAILEGCANLHYLWSPTLSDHVLFMQDFFQPNSVYIRFTHVTNLQPKFYLGSTSKGVMSRERSDFASFFNWIMTALYRPNFRFDTGTLRSHKTLEKHSVPSEIWIGKAGLDEAEARKVWALSLRRAADPECKLCIQGLGLGCEAGRQRTQNANFASKVWALDVRQAEDPECKLCIQGHEQNNLFTWAPFAIFIRRPDVCSLELALIQEWQPRLNYPFICQFFHPRKGLLKRPAMALNPQFGLATLWRKRRRKFTPAVVKEILSSDRFQNRLAMWKLIHDLGSNTKSRFEATKFLRSHQGGLTITYAIRRLACNMQEPFRTMSLQAIDSITWWKGKPAPKASAIRVPWTLSPGLERTLSQFLRPWFHEVLAHQVPCHNPSFKVLFVKHQAVLDILCNHNDWSMGNIPPCCCKDWQAYRSASLNLSGSHWVLSGSLLAPLLQPALQPICSGSLFNKACPSKRDYCRQMSQSFRRWARMNGLVHPDSTLPRTHRHLVASEKTFMDPQVFTPTDDAPTQVVDALVDTLKTQYGRAYPWAVGRGRQTPSGYILSKAKMQYQSGRPIISFVDVPFRPMLNILARLLYQLIPVGCPHHFAVSDVYELLSILKSIPDDQLLRLFNQDLAGFFTGIEIDRFIGAWYMLLDFLRPKMNVNNDEVFSVYPGKSNQPGDIIKGRTFRRCIKQRRGSPMGSPLSPALCPMVVSISEEIWHCNFREILSNHRLFIRHIRYVDNRLLIGDPNLVDLPPYETLLDEGFYGRPILLETEPDQEFLGFMIATEPFELIYCGAVAIFRLSSQSVLEWLSLSLPHCFSTLSSLADANWNYYAMDPRNHVPLTTMEEKALWQYTKYAYANQVDTFTFDIILAGVVERIEEQWQVSVTTDDLEIRFDENNGLEVFQVSEHNMDTGSFREHQVEFFFYKLVGDWHTAQKMGNYRRHHYGLPTLPVDPVEATSPPPGVHFRLDDVSALDPATVYAAQLMTTLRSLPQPALPDVTRAQVTSLVQDSQPQLQGIVKQMLDEAQEAVQAADDGVQQVHSEQIAISASPSAPSALPSSVGGDRGGGFRGAIPSQMGRSPSWGGVGPSGPGSRPGSRGGSPLPLQRRSPALAAGAMAGLGSQPGSRAASPSNRASGAAQLEAYRKHDLVDYWSVSHGDWLPATVMNVDIEGRIVIDLKPNTWLTKEDQATKVRRRARAGTPGGLPSQIRRTPSADHLGAMRAPSPRCVPSPGRAMSPHRAASPFRPSIDAPFRAPSPRRRDAPTPRRSVPGIPPAGGPSLGDSPLRAGGANVACGYIP